MTVAEIVGAIVEYGVVPVLIAVFLFLMIKENKANKKTQNDLGEQYKKMAEQFDKQEERLTDLLDGILDLAKQNNRPEQVHSKEEEEEGRRINNFINSQLNSLLMEEGANRACVFSYHNGGKDMTGRGYQKMSITNEQVDMNTVPIMSSYQNVPRTMFPMLPKKLSSQDVYYIDDVENIHEEDQMTYQFFTTHGAKAAYIQGIKRNDRVLIGFVLVEYTISKCKDKLKVQAALEDATLRITGALVTRD